MKPIRIFGNPFKVGVTYRGILTTTAVDAVEKYTLWLNGPHAGFMIPGLARELSQAIPPDYSEFLMRRVAAFMAGNADGQPTA